MAAAFGSAPQDGGAKGIKIAPEVHITAVKPVGVHVDRFAVADHPGHHPQDHIVGNPIFLAEAVVAHDNVIPGTNLNDAVQDVFFSYLVQYRIVFPAAFGAFFLISMMSRR